MPFAPTIRKQILSALNEHIIPQLQTKTVAQVFACPPFYFTGVEPSVEQKVLLSNKKANPLNMLLHWDEVNLDARRVALLGFSYSGCSEAQVGVTRQMARDLKVRNLPVPPGITTFQLPSPVVFYVPPLVPHSGRSLSEDTDVHRVLLLWFAEREFWISHHDAAAGGTHILNIADPIFLQMKSTYAQALKKQEFNAAQLLLLDLMRGLSDYLTKHTATVNNSAWPAFEEKSILVAPHVSARNTQYCYKVIDYIQFHLHTPLSVEVLAKVCDVTAPHLSTVFRKSTGMTLMNYVTAHRLRAAEMMLVSTSERIGDIAKLTGFSDTCSFANAFRRRNCISPTQYRKAQEPRA